MSVHGGREMSSKTEVLKCLTERKGTYISGENMARELGLSRNAVWKAVKALKSDGFMILSSTNRGYMLENEPDVLSEASIRSQLDPKIGNIGIKVYPVIESTSETAKKMALDGAPHGTIVVADGQTCGRGRRSHGFYSPEGGIYVSMILRPESFPYRDAKTVTAYAAVAAVQTIFTASGKRAGIKPVNDIFLDGKKVCGILTESMSDFESGDIAWIVIGIGMNYCLKEDELPEELRGKAGSVFGPSDHKVTRSRIIADLAERLLTGFLTACEEDVIREYESLLINVTQ